MDEFEKSLVDLNYEKPEKHAHGKAYKRPKKYKKVEENPLGTGRNAKPIDWEVVDLMLQAGCKGVQIAPMFNLGPEGFYQRFYNHYGLHFSDAQRQRRDQGDGRLLTKQFTEALKGDKQLLIWLGKNRLRQSDNPQDEKEFDGKLKELLETLKTMRKDDEATSI